MSYEIQKESSLTNMQKFLTEHSGEFKKALPALINPERFMRTALTVIAANKSLQKCSLPSVAKSMVIAAQLGLDFDPVRGEAYLVPYFTKGNYECTFIPGYKGLLRLARNTGKITDINACVVYENEPFEYREGLDRFLKHEPLPPAKRGDKIIGAYAVARLKDGATSWRFLWFESIEKIKNASLSKCSEEARKYSPWVTSEEAMILKTAFRRLCSWMELSPEIQKAVAIDEAQEAGLRVSQNDIFDDMTQFENTEQDDSEIAATPKVRKLHPPKIEIPNEPTTTEKNDLLE